jgi:hypothetical protein
MGELAKYLSDFDPIGVESAVTGMEKSGIPAELNSDYHELSRRLQDLDYAAAKTTLAAMQKALHELMGKES